MLYIALFTVNGNQKIVTPSHHHHHDLTYYDTLIPVLQIMNDMKVLTGECCQAGHK